MSTVAIIPNVKAQSFKNIDFKALLQSIHEGDPVKPEKRALPLFTCGPLSGKRTPYREVDGKRTGGAVRHDDAITGLAIAIGDHDSGEMTMQAAADKLRAAGIEATLYTTPSHTHDKPRWRVVVRLARQVPKRTVDALKALYQRVVAYLDHLLGGDILKGESYTLSQSFYYGRVQGVEYQVIDVPGKRLDAMKVPSVLRPKTRATPAPGGNGTDNYLNDFLVAAREESTYHQGLLRLSASYLGRGYSQADAIRMTQEAMQLAPARGDKWQTRYDDIPRLVEGAIARGIGTVAGTMPARRQAERPPDEDGEQVEVELLPLVDLRVEHPVPPPIIKDWLYDRIVTLQAGDGGIGKSYLLLLECMVVALGDTTAYSAPCEKRRVLYYSAEDDRAHVIARMRSYCNLYGWDYERVAQGLLVVDRTDADCTFFAEDRFGGGATTEEFARFDRTVRHHGVGMVAIDNASHVFGGNENARAQVRQFLSALAALKIAVLLAAHVNKVIAAAGDRGNAAVAYSGSTAWSNSVRSRRLQTMDDARTRGTVEVAKANYGPTGTQLGYRWDSALKLFMPLGFTLRQAARDHAAPLLALLASLVDRPGSLKASAQTSTARALVAHPECPKGLRRQDVQRWLEEQAAKGLIEQVEVVRENRHKGQCVRLTAAGEDALRG